MPVHKAVKARSYVGSQMARMPLVRDPDRLPNLSLVGFLDWDDRSWWIGVLDDSLGWTGVATHEGSIQLSGADVVLLARATDVDPEMAGWVAEGSGKKLFESLARIYSDGLHDGDLVAAQWPGDPLWHVGIADWGGHDFGMILDESEIRPLTGDPDGPRIVLLARAREGPHEWRPRGRHS